MSTATQIIEPRYPTEVRAEARRIADRDQYLSAEALSRIEAAVAYRFWQRSIEPLLAMKYRLYSESLIGNVIHIIDPDGGLMRTKLGPLSPSAIEGIQMIDKMIAAEAKRWGL